MGNLKSSALESLARALTVFTFILLCWVAHRVLQVREACVSSSFISTVRFDSASAGNCLYESRLDLRHLTSPLTRSQAQQIRALEVLEPLSSLFGGPGPRLIVEIQSRDPRAFELTTAGVRLGEAWLNDPAQTRRALVMAFLRTRQEYNQYQLEVLTDFLVLALYNDDAVQGSYSLRKDMKFPTAAAGLEPYCRSPFRSLAHHTYCQLPDPDHADVHAGVWGFRPLLASALWRAFDKLPLNEKINVLNRIKSGAALPAIATVENPAVENLVEWFETALGDYAAAFGIAASEEGQFALRRALKELEVEAPTHWELTVDVTQTPAWKEIVEQLKTRSRFRAKERALVFTPEGEVALPSGLQVAWNAQDIQSQKHVMIACEWPASGAAVHVQARQIFAKKTCDKLSGAFWD